MIRSRASGVLAAAGAALLLGTVPAVAGAGTWTSMPSGASTGVLTAVAARTDSDAWAIGTAGILRWDGTAWSAVSTTGVPAGMRMNGVAASTANDAWIVGSVRPSGYSNRLGTALHWDGTAWTALSPTLPTRSDLLGVVALSPTNAWAVGKIGVNSLVEHWDGTAWTQASLPEPTDGYSNGLVSVSANGPNDIWAVGTYVTSEGNETYSVHYNGTAWSVVPMPKAPQTTSFPTYTLTSVVTLSATDAWAVGQVSAGAPTDTLVEHWNGTAWSVVASPTPGLYPVVRSVSARSASDVWAVGDIATTGQTPQYRTFTLHWNGTSWSRVASPPTNAYSELYGVAASTSHVWAVGNDDTGAPFILERH